MTDLYQILQEHKVLTETNRLLLQKYQKRWNKSQYESLVETKLFTEAALADYISIFFNKALFTTSADLKADPRSLSLLPFKEAMSLGVMPLASNESGEAYVLLYDPTSQLARQKLDDMFPTWSFGIATRDLVIHTIENTYPITAQVPALKSMLEKL